MSDCRYALHGVYRAHRRDVRAGGRCRPPACVPQRLRGILGAVQRLRRNRRDENHPDARNQEPHKPASAASGRPLCTHTAQATLRREPAKRWSRRVPAVSSSSNSRPSAEPHDHSHRRAAPRRTPGTGWPPPASCRGRRRPAARAQQAPARGWPAECTGSIWNRTRRRKPARMTHQTQSSRAASNRPRGTPLRERRDQRARRLGQPRHDPHHQHRREEPPRLGAMLDRREETAGNARGRRRTSGIAALARAASTNQGAAMTMNSGSPQRNSIGAAAPNRAARSGTRSSVARRNQHSDQALGEHCERHRGPAAQHPRAPRLPAIAPRLRHQKAAQGRQQPEAQ